MHVTVHVLWSSFTVFDPRIPLSSTPAGFHHLCLPGHLPCTGRICRSAPPLTYTTVLCLGFPPLCRGSPAAIWTGSFWFCTASAPNRARSAVISSVSAFCRFSHCRLCAVLYSAPHLLRTLSTRTLSLFSFHSVALHAPPACTWFFAPLLNLFFLPHALTGALLLWFCTPLLVFLGSWLLQITTATWICVTHLDISSPGSFLRFVRLCTCHHAPLSLPCTYSYTLTHCTSSSHCRILPTAYTYAHLESPGLHSVLPLGPTAHVPCTSPAPLFHAPPRAPPRTLSALVLFLDAAHLLSHAPHPALLDHCPHLRACNHSAPLFFTLLDFPRLLSQFVATPPLLHWFSVRQFMGSVLLHLATCSLGSAACSSGLRASPRSAPRFTPVRACAITLPSQVHCAICTWLHCFHAACTLFSVLPLSPLSLPPAHHVHYCHSPPAHCTLGCTSGSLRSALRTHCTALVHSDFALCTTLDHSTATAGSDATPAHLHDSLTGCSSQFYRLCARALCTSWTYCTSPPTGLLVHGSLDAPADPPAQFSGLLVCTSFSLSHCARPAGFMDLRSALSGFTVHVTTVTRTPHTWISAPAFYLDHTPHHTTFLSPLVHRSHYTS